MIKCWIASNTFFSFAEELQKLIQESIAILLNRDSSHTLPITSKTSSKVTGFTTLSSLYIVKGDLHIKSDKYNRGHPIKLSINPDNQVLLSQLQMTANCLRKCLMESKSIRADDFDNISHHIQRISSLISQCNNYLIFQDPKRLFPSTHEPTFADLPFDCAVDFTINDTKLLTTIHCLSFPDGNPLEHALSQLKHVDTIKVLGKNAQVVDKVVVETTIPFLVDLKKCIEKIEALCQDVKYKLESL